MASDQPNLMDQKKNNAKGKNVPLGWWFLMIALIVAVLALVLRPSDAPKAVAMLDRSNPQIGPKDAPITIV